MEAASISNLNTPFNISSSFGSSQKTKPLTALSVRPRKKMLPCLKHQRSASVELERKLEAEMNPEGDDWMMELGKLREKCCKKRGMVETLECLEKEAIMGEDEGRLPTDYHRRALIFDKSSRVFQALKEHSTLNSS